MPEETNSPESSTSPEDPTAFAEAEWSDDSAYDSLGESPEATDPIPSQADTEDEAQDSTDETMPASAMAEVTEAEWSDDSAYDFPKAATDTASEDADTATEAWNEATFEWDEELAEAPEAPPTPPTTQEALSWLKPMARRFKGVWQRLLAGVRHRIPAVAELPDAALGGIIVGTLVLLLVLLNGVRQPSVASSSSNPLSEPEQTTMPVVTSEDDLTGQADMDTAAIATEAKPVPIESAPTVVDGDRIAKIQSQMTDSSILNAQRVVDSVQADFTRNQLTLIFNGDWYRLSDYDQTQLAQALLQQSQTLEFDEIQCLTSEGDLLARSPVVGSNVVIMQRERPPEVPEPERPRFRIMIDR